MRRHLAGLLLLVTAAPLTAVPPMPAVAEGYVAEALQRNLALAARELDVEQARARLAEARSAFQPRLDIVARYSGAAGGRTIDIPTGDLLNGVYRTLNDYLRSQGQPAAFPQVGNDSIPLLRSREQETKLRLVQPLWRPEIARTARSGREAVAAREAQRAAYRRELRLDVLAAYFGWLQAEAAVGVFTTAAELTTEALRTNHALAAVDKITDDRALRAEADDLLVRQQLAEAERDRNAARSYFDFLLNRPLESPIERPAPAELQQLTDALLAAPPADAVSIERREELEALRRSVAAATATEDAVRARLQPTLALAVEGGIQGETYRTGGDADFVQGSLIAELNVWDGRQRHSEVQQARIERRRAELQLEETRQRIRLQAQQAADEYRAAIAAHTAALRRAQASERAFDIVRQREQAGLVAQLGFLDARTELTRAQLNRTITAARLVIAAAAFDRATAQTPLP